MFTPNLTFLLNQWSVPFKPTDRSFKRNNPTGQNTSQKRQENRNN